MRKKTYYKRNRDVILNRGKDCYKNDKERSREQAKDKYRNLSEEEKNRLWENREYGKNRYNMSEEKKQRLKEYQKKNTVRLKSLNIIINKIVLIVYAVIYAN